MSVIDDEGKLYLDNPKVSIVGIEVISTKTPKAIKDNLKELCLKLLRDDNETQFRQAITNYNKIWNNLN